VVGNPVPLTATPTSWLKPALAVHRSTLALTMAIQLPAGTLTV